MNKKPAIQAPKKTDSTEELLIHLRELAWNGQHARVIDLATQELSVPKIKPAWQMNLLDLRAESYLAQGKLDLAAKDAQAMQKLATSEKTPVFKAQALNRKAMVQM